MRKFLSSLFCLATLVVCAPALEARAETPELASLLTSYLKSHSELGRSIEQKDPLQQAVWIAERGKLVTDIIAAVYATPGSPDYLAALKAVDERFPENNEAVYDLARALQLHWEKEYGTRLIESRDEWIRKGSVAGRAGLLLPALYGAASFMPGAAKVAVHFGMVRMLIMSEASGAAGSLVGQAAHGFLHDSIPLSPAHIMRVGMPDGEWSQVEDKHLVREALKDVGLFYASIKIPGVAKIFKGPIKANLAQLAVTLLVQYVGGKILDAGFEAWDYHKLLAELAKSFERLQDPALRADVLLLYQETDHAVNTAIRLSSLVNRPMLAAADAYNSKVDDLPRSYPPASAEFLSRSRELSRKLGLKASKFLQSTRKVESDLLIHQVAESLKSAQKPYLGFQVEFLENLVERSQWLKPLLEQGAAQ